MPDRSQGFETYDALVMSPAPYLPIEVDRVKAMREWVLGGGTLVVDASQRTDAFRLGLLRELLPFVPQGVDQGRLDLFDSTADFAHGEVRGGEVLLESNGHPLAVRWNYGLGSVTCFAIAPNSPAFTQWKGCTPLWREVLASLRLGRAGPTDFNSFNAAAERKNALAGLVQEPQRVGLRLGIVLLLTALYALAVGPGDYFLIKRLGKPKLTWITFPTIVAVFTVAAYLGARTWVGGEMASASMQRVLVFPEHGVALRYDIVSLFAPGGKDFRLQHADGLPLHSIRAFSPSEGGLQVDHDNETLVQYIPIWQRRVYGAGTCIDAGPSVSLELSREDQVLVATIINGSSLELRQNALLCGSKTWRIPQQVIRPGESIVVRLEGHGQSSPDMAHVAAWSHLSSDTPDFWAHGRQFDYRTAFARGAVMFHSGDAGQAPCPLIVDGKRRPESGRRVLEVLAYEKENP